MEVRFARNYFGPDGQRYRPGMVYDIPPDWKDILPKGTLLVDQKDDVRDAEEDLEKRRQQNTVDARDMSRKSAEMDSAGPKDSTFLRTTSADNARRYQEDESRKLVDNDPDKDVSELTEELSGKNAGVEKNPENVDEEASSDKAKPAESKQPVSGTFSLNQTLTDKKKPAPPESGKK